MGITYRMRKRVFVNREPTMTAAIVAVVEDTSAITGGNPNDWMSGQITLMLTDCIRKVTFDFDLDTPADRKKALYKARKLAEVINGFVEALEEEVASIESRKNKPKTKAATG